MASGQHASPVGPRWLPDRDSDAAVAAYAEQELAYRDRDLIEIVLIGSDSLETVKLTHANYFDGSVAISKYLVGLVSTDHT